MSDQLWFSIMMTNTVLILPLVAAPVAEGVRLAVGVAGLVCAVPLLGETVGGWFVGCVVGVTTGG